MLELCWGLRRELWRSRALRAQLHADGAKQQPSNGTAHADASSGSVTATGALPLIHCRGLRAAAAVCFLRSSALLAEAARAPAPGQKFWSSL